MIDRGDVLNDLPGTSFGSYRLESSFALEGLELLFDLVFELLGAVFG